MGFKSKAAVAVSGALTAGAFATLATAIPAGAATSGTEQSETGVVFAVANNGAIVGANQTGRNTECSRSSRRGGGVTFSSSGRCVTDGRGGLSLQRCDSNNRWQKFDEVGGSSPYSALLNEGSHQYVTEHGAGQPVVTVSVHSYGHFRRLNLNHSQLWKWTTFSTGRPGQGGPGNGGGGRGGNPNPGQSGTATATTRVTHNGDGGHSSTSPYWAIDNFDRTVTVKLGTSVPTSNCGTT